MEQIKKYWWVIGTRGLLFGLFGFIAVTSTYMDVRTLLYYLGLMFLGVGVVQAGISIVLRKSITNWLWLIVISLADIFIAYFLIVENSNAEIYYQNFMAFWAFTIGIAMIIVSFKQKTMRIFIHINAALSLGFGAVIYFNLFQIRNINFVIGFYSIMFSIFVVFIAIKLYTYKKPTSLPENPNSAI